MDIQLLLGSDFYHCCELHLPKVDSGAVGVYALNAAVKWSYAERLRHFSEDDVSGANRLFAKFSCLDDDVKNNLITIYLIYTNFWNVYKGYMTNLQNEAQKEDFVRNGHAGEVDRRIEQFISYVNSNSAAKKIIHAIFQDGSSKKMVDAYSFISFHNQKKQKLSDATATRLDQGLMDCATYMSGLRKETPC